jgi:hypothetical protein
VIRTQISLSRDQMDALRREARRRGISIAALVRAAVDAVLAADEGRIRAERALEAIGGFHSGRSDIGLEHDRYVFDDRPA